MPIHNDFGPKNPPTSPHDLQAAGPRLAVRITPTPQDHDAYRRAGISVPGEHVGSALIDTGAETCAIDVDAAAHLRLLAVDVETITGASGAAEFPVYFVSLHFPNTKLPSIPLVRCAAMPLGALGIVGIIGREVLKDYAIFYNGPAGHFSVAV